MRGPAPRARLEASTEPCAQQPRRSAPQQARRPQPRGCAGPLTPEERMSFLTRTSLKNRLIVGLTTVAVAVLGLISMGSLKQELMPSMQVPAAFVSVQSQGLAPEEMARTVTV
jgi:HAE1 family hydrophobic/amphiphilic exporter-1